MELELIGVGSPLMDLLVHVDDHFITDQVGGAKGGMEMVEAPALAAWLDVLTGPIHMAPGGAASNTTVGCANLGISTGFIGCIGGDETGAAYRAALTAQHCEDLLIEHPNEPSGRVLSLITPDAERTMRTNLGAAAALSPADITAERFAGARLVMLEGYTLFNHDLTRAVARAAKEANCELALDLASFEVVAANKAVLGELLDGQVDIVFANEDEASAWAGSVEAAIDDLAQRCRVAAVKLGADGAWLVRGEERVHVGIEPVDKVIDTTGAGDTWAAGFLAGYLRGLPLEACGRLGAMAGAAVVQVDGAQVPASDWRRIRGYLDAWV